MTSVGRPGLRDGDDRVVGLFWVVDPVDSSGVTPGEKTFTGFLRYPERHSHDRSLCLRSSHTSICLYVFLSFPSLTKIL